MKHVARKDRSCFQPVSLGLPTLSAISIVFVVEFCHFAWSPHCLHSPFYRESWLPQELIAGEIAAWGMAKYGGPLLLIPGGLDAEQAHLKFLQISLSCKTPWKCINHLSALAPLPSVFDVALWPWAIMQCAKISLAASFCRLLLLLADFAFWMGFVIWTSSFQATSFFKAIDFPLRVFLGLMSLQLIKSLSH